MATGGRRAIHGAGRAEREQSVRYWPHHRDADLRKRKSHRPDFAHQKCAVHDYRCADTQGLSPQGVDQDDIVVMPYTSAMKRVIGGTTLRNMDVQMGDPGQIAAAQQQIISLLRQRHNIRPGRDDDFTVRTQQEIAEAATATSKVMTLLLGAIAGVSLVVGGIGIMNIMLVSVTERTREIGVRMAVGAHGIDILTQFLIEAVTLSYVGGLIGIICGIGASRILSIYAHWPTLISISSIAIAFLFSAAVGVFFGFYPARKAAAPVDSIRNGRAQSF